MVSVRVKRWTRAEYDRIAQAGLFAPDERVELIEGEIVEMSPQDPEHSTAIVVGEETLRSAFGADYHVRSQLPLALGDDSEPEPDLAVVQGPRRAFAASHPSTASLVVEVSDSSLPFDRDRKGPMYARAGIPEYWIVNIVDHLLEVYRVPRADVGYATRLLLTSSDVISPLALPTARIEVREMLP